MLIKLFAYYVIPYTFALSKLLVMSLVLGRLMERWFLANIYNELNILYMRSSSKLIIHVDHRFSLILDYSEISCPYSVWSMSIQVTGFLLAWQMKLTNSTVSRQKPSNMWCILSRSMKIYSYYLNIIYLIISIQTYNIIRTSVEVKSSFFVRDP